jgi:hypothetical protein
MGETDAQGMCMYIHNEVLASSKADILGLGSGRRKLQGNCRGEGVMVNTVEESASIPNWSHQDIIEWERDIECEQQQ